MGTLDYEKWFNLSYLREGTPLQKKAWDILKKTKIMDLLKEYDPVLIGTIPINIAIEGSDIDIACEVHDFVKFKKDLKRIFPDIICNQKEKTLVGQVTQESIAIEIYGECKPVREQNGFVHMVKEDYFLKLGSEKIRQEILRLKRMGYKTEPAFAKLLKLEGDPYQALLVCDPELIFKKFCDSK